MTQHAVRGLVVGRGLQHAFEDAALVARQPVLLRPPGDLDQRVDVVLGGALLLLQVLLQVRDASLCEHRRHGEGQSGQDGQDSHGKSLRTGGVRPQLPVARSRRPRGTKRDHASFHSEGIKFNCGVQRGARGGRSRCRPARRRSRSPLRALQRVQAATQFSHVVRPPRERGTMWSIVSWMCGGRTPQVLALEAVPPQQALPGERRLEHRDAIVVEELHDVGRADRRAAGPDQAVAPRNPGPVAEVVHAQRLGVDDVGDPAEHHPDRPPDRRHMDRQPGPVQHQRRLVEDAALRSGGRIHAGGTGVYAIEAAPPDPRRRAFQGESREISGVPLAGRRP